MDAQMNSFTPGEATLYLAFALPLYGLFIWATPMHSLEGKMVAFESSETKHGLQGINRVCAHTLDARQWVNGCWST
jgi:hypothetical protein